MKRALLLLAACGDNATRPDARVIERHPDLTLIGDLMKDTLQVVPGTFAATDCEVVEQCVNAPGPRRLLRFDTVTANLGNADLVVGSPPPMGASDDIFEWSPCHGHHHVKGYAKYELRDASGVVVVGRKQSFCLHDVQAIQPVTGTGYDCGNQGISAGWADVYSRNLSCQWIDATDVAPGTYTLNVEVNAARVLEESDVTNNSFSVEVTL